MTCDILIVTFARDFPYLSYCLKSIDKFVRGINGVYLLVPHEDVDGARAIVNATPKARDFPILVNGYAEKPGKGMLWHMRQILYADTWATADIIAHLDADCVFDSPVSPEKDFLDENGRIILRYEPFTSICKRHDAMARWQECTQRCLPFSVKHETMRGHPEVYNRSTYPLARDLVQRKVNMRIDEYILSCQNEFPQTFCEHVTLGNVAMERQPALYHPFCQVNDTPTPDNKVFQAWSHGPIDQPQDLWYKGKQERFVPKEMFEKILGRFVPSAEEKERMAQ